MNAPLPEVIDKDPAASSSLVRNEAPVRPPPRQRVLLAFRGGRLLARTGATPVGLIFVGVGTLAALAISLLGLDRLPVALCTFKAITGLPCPTCGSTRVLGRVAALDFLGAVAMNPLAAGAGVVLLLWGMGDLLLRRRGEALILEVGPRTSRVLWIVGGVVVLVNWIWLIYAGR